MGPGLYMFQTRVVAASCGDTERTGYVNSFYAMIDGIPGARSMDMQLLGLAFWPAWTRVVSAGGAIVGDAEVERAKATDRASHFELARDGKRFKGRGVRSYTATLAGNAQRCSLSYDAWLVRVDS